ncbi:hypothetical protein ACFLT3_00155 [Chloroflexota bacterium]
MSRASLFIFIESHADRYAYSCIVDPVFINHDMRYEFVTAEEIKGSSGGKQNLLKFFDYLKRRGSLIDTYKGKKTASVFYLDKDVDDLLRTQRRSNHIVYTSMYELENYLFMYGDLAYAAAASASIDIASLRDGLGDFGTWRLKSAENWKQWVQLCLYSHKHCIGGACNYSQPFSSIHKRAWESFDNDSYQSHLARIQSKSKLDSSKFLESFKRLCSRVNRIYKTGQHDSIFKGKWYRYFLAEDVHKIASGRRYNKKGFESKIIGNLAQSVDFSADWANRFRSPLSLLIASVSDLQVTQPSI